MNGRSIFGWTLALVLGLLVAGYGVDRWLTVHPHYTPRGYIKVVPLHPLNPLKEGQAILPAEQLHIELKTQVYGLTDNPPAEVKNGPYFADSEQAKRVRPEEKPVPPAFIIGVWCQPARSFAIWKARGVNTVVGYESESNRTSIDDWTGTAAQDGLFMIRQPHPNIQDDVDEPYLLAWIQGDEPDIKKPPLEPAQLAGLYNQCKAADPKRPVFLNISGGNVLFDKVPEKTYREYFKYADWIGNDFYPVTGWNNPKLLPKVGQLVDKLRDWSGGKPQFAFIETSNQRLPWVPRDTPGVTVGQFRAEVWDAVIHGAAGVVYFPQQIGYGFQYDNTPIDVSVELSKQDQILNALGAVLKTPANPAAIGVAAPAPIEATWRKAEDGTIYIFALNLSPDVQRGQTLTLKGITASTAQTYKESDRKLPIVDAKLTDDFQAFEVHIYTIAAK